MKIRQTTQALSRGEHHNYLDYLLSNDFRASEWSPRSPRLSTQTHHHPSGDATRI